jgi:hypothetical protein
MVGLIFILTAILSGIAAIFWYQEIQYLLPTPVPKNYRAVLPHEAVQFDSLLIPHKNEKPKLLHFFSPDCPCSRFNLKHFLTLNRKYSQTIDFYVVIVDKEKVTSARYMVGGEVPIIVDSDETLAKAW